MSWRQHWRVCRRLLQQRCSMVPQRLSMVRFRWYCACVALHALTEVVAYPNWLWLRDHVVFAGMFMHLQGL